MRPELDLTDVAHVLPLDMAVPMNHMVETGRGLVFLKGASAEDMRMVDAAVWNALSCDAAQRVAVLLRFRSLVQVFAGQRLKQLLLQKGFNLLAPALHVAATMRLNAERGFNPLKFERALRETMARLEAAQKAPMSPEPPFQAAA